MGFFYKFVSRRAAFFKGRRLLKEIHYCLLAFWFLVVRCGHRCRKRGDRVGCGPLQLDRNPFRTFCSKRIMRNFLTGLPISVLCTLPTSMVLGALHLAWGFMTVNLLCKFEILSSVLSVNYLEHYHRHKFTT